MDMTDLGIHEFTIKASYKNETFEEEWVERFIVEIIYVEDRID